MVVAAVFMVTFAVVKANQCSSGGECPGGNKPNNVVSMLQTKLQTNSLNDGGDGIGTNPHTLSVLEHAESPHVCILARTCGPSSKCSPGETTASSVSVTDAFLASVRAQAYLSWELHVLNAEGGGEVFQDSVLGFKDPRLSNGPSSPTSFASNTYGYDATNYALERLLHGDNVQAPCDYFLFTNADNLYGKDFFKIELQSMQAGLDLIGFNFVTRYEQYDLDGSGKLVGHMPMQQASFALGRIDLGAVLVSAQAIQELGLRFPTEPGTFSVPDPVLGQIVHDKLKIADWLFFLSIMNRSGSKGQVMMHEVPFMHQ